MDETPPIIDKISSVIGIVTFVFSLGFFYSGSKEFFYSFLAALITAFLIWSSYILFRCFYIAIKK